MNLKQLVAQGSIAAVLGGSAFVAPVVVDRQDCGVRSGVAKDRAPRLRGDRKCCRIGDLPAVSAI